MSIEENNNIQKKITFTEKHIKEMEKVKDKLKKEKGFHIGTSQLVAMCLENALPAIHNELNKMLTGSVGG